MYDAIGKLAVTHKRKRNVQVAALKQGNPRCDTNSKPLTAADLKHVTMLFDFKKPKDVRSSDVKSKMKISGCVPLLYPGIHKAMELIEQKCNEPGNAAKCRRKVIVVALSDGVPGASPQKYYSASYPKGDLPINLLTDARKKGIEVHTVCAGLWCNDEIWQCKRFHDPRLHDTYVSCFGIHGQPGRKVVASGARLLRTIAKRTGGKYYGRVR